MKTKEAIIERAVDCMLEATELGCDIGEFDKETLRISMRNIWRTAFKKGKAMGRAEVENEIEKENEEIRVEQEHVYESGISKGVMGR